VVVDNNAVEYLEEEEAQFDRQTDQQLVSYVIDKLSSRQSKLISSINHTKKYLIPKIITHIPSGHSLWQRDGFSLSHHTKARLLQSINTEPDQEHDACVTLFRQSRGGSQPTTCTSRWRRCIHSTESLIVLTSSQERRCPSLFKMLRLMIQEVTLSLRALREELISDSLKELVQF
jgi:hypothetical protein